MKQLATRRLLTLAEVAAELRISRVTAWRIVKAGQIHSFRAGKAYRVLREDLEDYIRNGSRASARLRKSN